MTISINTSATTITVSAPYHPDFPGAARALGGKWDGASKTWTFDPRDDERVRALCLEIYGDDGTGAGEVVTLLVTVHGRWVGAQDALYLSGRQVARAFGRDSGAKLGDGVVVLEGGFGSGGSVKNWTTHTNDTDGVTRFELRDVPRAAAEKTLAGADPDKFTIEIIGDTDIDAEALRAERDRLTARLAEIDALLAS